MNRFLEKVSAAAVCAAGMLMGNAQAEAMEVHGRYHVEHIRDGKVIWSEDFDNLVTTAGKNDLLDIYLAGSSYTAALFMGLKGTGTALAADTQASHSGWLEVGGTNAPAYSSTRKTPAWSSASAGSKTVSSAVSFVFTSGGNVFGCFLNRGGTSAQDNTTGTLFSAGDFTSSRAVLTGDTLNVTYTLSV